ncbi:MAG: diguanylate cyclase, partial [Clostridia bacterium]|nr:diguanylate cyclase [Clostridia bacterium]
MDSVLRDTLLLVGDADSDRAQLCRIFSSTYNILEAGTAAQACMLVRQNKACVAAVLADVPGGSKEEISVLSELCDGEGEEIPLIFVVEAVGTGEREELAFALGAADVITKPYTVSGVLNRVGTMVDLYMHKNHLEHMVHEQSESIRHTNQLMTDALSTIIEYRSMEAGNHVQRLRRFTRVLLEEAQRSCPEYDLSDRKIELISRAAALHDVGKISVPDSVLNKPGRLTPEEFEIIKRHTVDGGRMIEKLTGIGDVEFLRYAYNIAVGHHERWDGKGYPDGIKGNKIPFCAQVVGIADAFDALTTERVYKPAYPGSEAIDMILNGECGAFSPKLLECLKHVRKEMIASANQYADGQMPAKENLAAPLPEDVGQGEGLDALELLQVKYQTLIHHSNDMVLEVDLDERQFYVVYNPLPDFESIMPGISYDEFLKRLFDIGVHPDDLEQLRDVNRNFNGGFFDNYQSRRNFRCRYYSAAQQEYVPYDITVHRVYTGEEKRRLLLVILHRVDAGETAVPNKSASVLESDLIGSGVRCREDGVLSIISCFGMLRLTGYTDSELNEVFDGQFIQLVVPEDRAAVRAACSRVTVDGRNQLEFRIRHKSGRILHVLDQYRSGGVDFKSSCLHMLIDVTHLYDAVERQKHQGELNRQVLELSGSITFDWDFIADRIACSPMWEERIGSPAVTEQFTKQMDVASHFHPDDLPFLKEQVLSMQNGARNASMEARIADRNGEYIWYRVRAKSVFDENGRLMRIIGYLSDIDSLKSKAISMQYLAESDALTGVRNKHFAQRAVEDYLKKREPDSLAALLVMDLDNFKQVNDTYGHLHGDNLLMQVGAALRKLFRADDVIGRIGGDEFIVLLKDIPNREMVTARCRLLLDTFELLFKKNVGNLPVSFSIGGVLVPDHGDSYDELFRRADFALYRAKDQGKNCYLLYGPEMKPTKRSLKGGRHTTLIDSDSRPGIADNSLAISAFNQLYESHDAAATISKILAQVGTQLNVSRVYIFENNDENTTCSNTFEWCNTDIVPQKENLQDVSYITDIPGWPDAFDESGLFYCTDVALVDEPYRSILEPQGIKSMLSCAIMDNDVFRGYVGFDECSVNRVWTKEQIELLRTISRLLAVFLLRRRAREQAQAQLTNIHHLLDHQDAWIYVINPDTCEIKFCNAKARQLVGEEIKCEGKRCYELFMHRSERCPGCPAANIRQTESQVSVMNSPRAGCEVRAGASLVDW